MSFCGAAEEVLATLGILDGKSRWPIWSASEIRNWKCRKRRSSLVGRFIAGVHEECIQIGGGDRAIFRRIARTFVDSLLQQSDQDRLRHGAMGFAIEMVHGVRFVVLGKVTRVGGREAV